MFKFLLWHVLLVFACCELYKDESRYLEYAPAYDDYKPRDYQFEYAVSDPYTGDHKSQWEVKINGVVRGGYSLLEPDGTTRIVEYIADDGGFRALVKKVGTSIHPEIVSLPQTVSEVAHYGTYDGQIANYAAGKEITPILYQIPQNIESSAIKNVEGQQRISVLPNIQGQEFEKITAVPLQENNVRLQESSLDNIEIVPYIARTNIGEVLSPERKFSTVPEVPISNFQADFRNYNLPQQQIVPTIKEQNIQEQNYQEGFNVVPSQYSNIQEQVAVPVQGQIRPNYEELNLEQIQGYNRPNLQQPLPYYQRQLERAEVVANYETLPFQGQNIQADVQVPIRANNLPQPQIEIQNVREAVAPNQLAPALVPISPSYTTTINFEGLTDQNRLKKDIYHASQSESVLKFVPSSNKLKNKSKKQFLIYYPDSETK